MNGLDGLGFYILSFVGSFGVGMLVEHLTGSDTKGGLSFVAAMGVAFWIGVAVL